MLPARARSIFSDRVAADQRGHGIGVALDVFIHSSVEARRGDAEVLESSTLSQGKPDVEPAKAEPVKREGKTLRRCLTECIGVEEVADDSQVIGKLERETGVEPATSSLGIYE